MRVDPAGGKHGWFVAERANAADAADAPRLAFSMVRAKQTPDSWKLEDTAVP